MYVPGTAQEKQATFGKAFCLLLLTFPVPGVDLDDQKQMHLSNRWAAYFAAFVPRPSIHADVSSSFHVCSCSALANARKGCTTRNHSQQTASASCAPASAPGAALSRSRDSSGNRSRAL